MTNKRTWWQVLKAAAKAVGAILKTTGDDTQEKQP